MKYLWDSNTVVYYLQKLFPLSPQLFIDNVLKAQVPAFSVITEIELLSWRIQQEKDMRVVQDFISDSLVIELEPSIKLKTAELRKKYKIKIPDAIIAATALAYDLSLLTRNISDFKNIDRLKLVNPWDM